MAESMENASGVATSLSKSVTLADGTTKDFTASMTEADLAALGLSESA
jgi:hypothetical protein